MGFYIFWGNYSPPGIVICAENIAVGRAWLPFLWSYVGLKVWLEKAQFSVWSQGSLLSTKIEEGKVSGSTLGRSGSASRGGQSLKPNRWKPGRNTFGRKKVIYKGQLITEQRKESFSIQETEHVWYREKRNEWMGIRGFEETIGTIEYKVWPASQ